MYRLIYISTASDELTAADVDAILTTSQRHNDTHSITGVLIFNGLNFLQLLEGPRTSVENIYTRILMDTRHVSVKTVLAEPAELRIFAGWHMAGRKTPELAGQAGYEQLGGVRDVMDRQMPDRVRQILQNFNSLKGL